MQQQLQRAVSQAPVTFELYASGSEQHAAAEARLARLEQQVGVGQGGSLAEELKALEAKLEALNGLDARRETLKEMVQLFQQLRKTGVDATQLTVSGPALKNM